LQTTAVHVGRLLVPGYMFEDAPKVKVKVYYTLSEEKNEFIEACLSGASALGVCSLEDLPC